MEQQLIQLTVDQKINLGTTEIAKKVREQLKQEFPRCKFSITCEHYSGGSSISISIIKADRKIIQDFKELSETSLICFENRAYTREGIKETQSKNYHQLSPFNLREEFKINSWCNGVFLTEEGHKLLQRVVQISDQYNWDNSDSQTDYYDVHFSLDLEIGKWNKEFDRSY